MSVQNEIAAGGESVVLERPLADGVYASLFEKINLNPVSELSALDIWQDAQAMVGLFGLNEGLAILEALISHQWGGAVASASACPHGNPQQSEPASAATDALAPVELQ